MLGVMVSKRLAISFNCKNPFEITNLNVVILILGLFGLWAQAFNGYIIPGILVASLSLILTFGFSFLSVTKFLFVRWATLILSIVTILACIYDAYAYYSEPQIWGNYYGGWIWTVPVIICSLIFSRNLWFIRAKQSRP